MDAETLADEKQKVEELVAEGFRLFNEGRVDEARLIAEKSLEDLPEYTNALSLMGMCHERDGDLNAALICYEKIVELHPDSSLDKIKITQLRNALSAKLIEQPEPNSKRAWVGAVAACLLVVSLGVALAGFISNKNQEQAKLTPETQASNNTNAQINTPGLPQNQNNQQQTKPPQEQGNTENPQGTADPTGGRNTNSGNNDGGGRFNPTTTGVGPLPGTNGGNGLNGGTLGVQPVDPGPAVGNQNLGTGTTGGQGNGSTGTTIQPPKDTRDDPPVVDGGTKPPKNDGVIDIVVSHGSGTTTVNNGGSQPLNDNPNQLQALLQTARQHYLTGKYDLAARAYDQALRAGADPASTNQRLGQCYEKLNRKSDAIQAYSRAISAAQSQMNSGGNRERLQNMVDSCQQALNVLRG